MLAQAGLEIAKDLLRIADLVIASGEVVDVFRTAYRYNVDIVREASLTCAALNV